MTWIAAFIKFEISTEIESMLVTPNHFALNNCDSSRISLRVKPSWGDEGYSGTVAPTLAVMVKRERVL